MPQYTDRPIQPTIFVIFGATGDLAKKKLFPALLDLHTKQILPDQFHIIGFSRRDWGDEDFQNYVRGIFDEKGHNHEPSVIDNFLQNISYSKGTFDDVSAFKQLVDLIESRAQDFGTCVNRFFYFATPPKFYEVIARNLSDSGAASVCSDKEGWSRVLIEKPFGKDRASAMHLETELNKLFEKEQIFLIDHYLAKETIQNILLFRFSNAIFEPLWNSGFIERVEIKLHEQLGLEGRVTFYDGVGALRDVGQSHILQMLSLITMEHPGELHATQVRHAREQVLKKVRFDDSIPTVRGQYKGYTSEEGIDPNSQTETFFRVSAKIHNKRWKGTQFILESGKRLSKKKATISIYFKPASNPLCEGGMDCVLQNKLTFEIQPDEAVRISFWTRAPGFGAEMEENVLQYRYSDDMRKTMLPGAYEYVIAKALQGDQMLFRTPLEEHCSWRFIQRVVQKWEQYPLVVYDQETDPASIVNKKPL